MQNTLLLQVEHYSEEQLHDAAPIVSWRNQKSLDKYKHFDKPLNQALSNFQPLLFPIRRIIDWVSLYYRDSEWDYMQQRLPHLAQKIKVSRLSEKLWWSRTARKIRSDQIDHDKLHRIEYMRGSLHENFVRNQDLAEILLDTWDKQIIEYTYWWDTFFWIDQETLSWSNVLWKLLVELREHLKSSLINNSTPQTPPKTH